MFESISLYYTNDDTEIAYINFNEIDHIENINENEDVQENDYLVHLKNGKSIYCNVIIIHGLQK